MFAEFKHTLRKLRGLLIGWGIGLFLYDMLMSSFYSSMLELGEDFNTLLEAYPPEILAFFPSIQDFLSPVGYLETYFFAYMTIILGIFGASACAKLLVGDEEKGILDLVMAYPVSRTSLFWGRMLAFIVITAGVLLAAYLGWVIPAESAGLNLTLTEFLLPFIPLFALIVMLGGFALLLSMILPSARLTSGLTSALLVGNFLLVGMANLNEALMPIYEVSPFYFTQGAQAINGINGTWLAGLLAFGLGFTLLAWLLFQRRDIRVGGEGTWSLSNLTARFKRA